MSIRLIVVSLMVWLIPSSAFAFCGFFVGNTDKLYSDATQVVLMRSGQHTVLSIRPEYSGPVDDFAMVIPVPQVLQKDDVKTLPQRPFDEIAHISAPRLVEYYEADPCGRELRSTAIGRIGGRGLGSGGLRSSTSQAAKPRVRVKAQFAQGEYQIVILDADESSALETWLNKNGYKQPRGASRFLAPYVQQGMYFFAAKVDAHKVKFGAGGRAQLSPIQFRYESENFQLPIRLGLINTRGVQDLLIFILGQGRYEVANRRNLFIPTNINVSARRKDDFSSWYDGMFKRLLENRQTAVVTEYVWPVSMKCDPCPSGVSTLNPRTLMLLGGALLRGKASLNRLTLTRLHTRYGADSGTSDLTFRRVDPVVGGREVRVDGELEQGASESDRNAFQGRYAIRHRWRGKLTCENPQYGRWSHHVRASFNPN